MAEDKDAFVKEIADPEQDYSQWYVDTVLKADLADYGPTKGFMIIKPYGYALWENVQSALDARFKATGHVNAYFPLLIPESLLMKEAEHVEGFTPEVAWVTQGGDEVLSERLAVRPTSETVIMTMYSKWVQSWRDLPILINQWGNAVRWEKVTRPFLRGAEFLWQEGHTAHATADEALEETLRMLHIYHDFLLEDLAIPTLIGKKTDSEKFPGAEATYAVEAMMGNNRALQAGTSHFFGDRFARAYQIRYLDRDKSLRFAHTTSWGLSTRVIGGIVMVHGDDRGLIFPPRVAPIQVVIVPIGKGEDASRVHSAAAALRERLGALRVKLDDRDAHTTGWKFNDWEMRGVPLRIELGPKDLEQGHVVLARRDLLTRASVPMEGIEATVASTLDEIQSSLLSRARQHLDSHILRPADRSEFERVFSERAGWARGGWCGEASCEAEVKEATGATIRCLPLEQHPVTRCVACGGTATAEAVWGRAY